MKKRGIPYGILTFAILWLIYDVYYWNMRNTAGVLRNIDIIICMASGLICIVVIVLIIIYIIQKRHEHK